ncbi:MAG: choice-of-anchor A family protein, partial [Caldilineaceae bacterium]|nr:choice-of-anchor A family protein [Caldilineaceae bacterium]
DANANDASGNGFDGRLTNGATINTTASTNKIGAGKVLLDGSNDYVNLTNRVASFQSLNTGTIAAWVRPSSYQTGVIFEVADRGDSDSRLALIYDADGSVDFYIRDGFSTYLRLNTNAGRLPLNTWTHVAVTVDSTGNKIYVNGVQVTGPDLTYLNGSSSTDRFIDDVTRLDYMAWGAHRFSSIFFANRFPGFIDDARIYNRALSDAEVTALYAFDGSATPPRTDPQTACLLTPLGTADGFNLFTLDSATAFSGSTLGRAVIGGSANISSYGIGQSLTNSNGLRDDLIVQSVLTYSGGQVYNGNVVYGLSAIMSPDVFVPNGTVRQAQIYNMAQVTSELRTLSARLSQLPANGASGNQSGSLVLTGTDSERNVFSVSATDLSLANGIYINVPVGSTALINVSGISGTLANKAIYINNDNSDAPAGQERVLFNFYQASSLTVSSISVKGSILAPYALLNLTNGQVNGNVIANQILTSSAEIRNYLFAGCLPPQ